MKWIVCAAVLACAGCAVPGPYAVFARCPGGASALEARVQESGTNHMRALRGVCATGSTRSEAYHADTLRRDAVVTERVYTTRAPNARTRSDLYLERRPDEILPRFEFFYAP